MAKLVEILARELKDWVCDWPAIGQAKDGTLHREPFLGVHTPFSLTRASDYVQAIVSHAEWQAAVDALKQKDIASSTAAMIDAGWIDPKPPVSTSLHVQVLGRGNRIPQWDGVGLPPVGHTCERLFTEVDGSSWMGCIILAHGVKKIFIRDNAGDEFAHSLDEVEFRMFRTPEQIAAENREKEVNRMVAAVPMLDKGWARKVCYALYDNNYRKQEPK